MLFLCLLKRLIKAFELENDGLVDGLVQLDVAGEPQVIVDVLLKLSLQKADSFIVLARSPQRLSLLGSFTSHFEHFPLIFLAWSLMCLFHLWLSF